MQRLIAICVMTLLASGAVADDKNKGKGDAKGDNHGQVVSECNHRANERNLQGQDRKEWVDWCVDRGESHGYRADDWNRERSCYRNADQRGLKGDARREYLGRCIDDAGKQKSGNGAEKGQGHGQGQGQGEGQGKGKSK